MKKVLLITFLLLTNISFSQTIIKASNIQYAREKITFYQLSDPVTMDREELFTLDFDNRGIASTSIHLKETATVYCDFGVYRGMLYLEKNGQLDLELPPFKKKSFAESKNPYFVPVSFWFRSTGENELNSRISRFMQHFNGLTDRYMHEIYFRQSQLAFDSLNYFLDKQFGAYKDEVFTLHRNLNVKMVEVDAFRQKPENYANIFKDIPQFIWSGNVFIELFEKTFSGQLSFEAKTIKGHKVSGLVHQQNVVGLQNFVKQKFGIDGAIADLALLKMLYDAYFSGDFQKTAVQKTIEKAQFSQNSNSLVSKCAKNILERLALLRKGEEAPVIRLKTIGGELLSSNQDKEKFKLLIFADYEMLICKEHMKYLISFYPRYEKYLEIYVILRDTPLEGLEKFVKEKEVPGYILSDTGNKYSQQYRVRSYPQCYLLNKNHKVQFEHTKAPLDGFEHQFGNFLRNELFMQQRNQSR